MFDFLQNPDAFHFGCSLILTKEEKDLELKILYNNNNQDNVINKTFKSIFNVLHGSLEDVSIMRCTSKRSFFKKETLGVNLLAAFSRYFVLFMENNKEEIDQEQILAFSEKNVNDDFENIYGQILSLFNFPHSNICQNRCRPHLLNEEQSLYFNFFFNKVGEKRNKVISFGKIPLKCMIEYIFIFETYRFVYHEIEKCIDQYGHDFVIRLPDHYYFYINNDDLLSMDDFLKTMETYFLKITEEGINDIEYMFETFQNKMRNDRKNQNFHIKPQDVFEQLNLYRAEKTSKNKKNMKKISHYLNKMTNDYHIIERFYFILSSFSSVIQFTYDLFKNCDSATVKVKDIREVFTSIVLKSVRVKEWILYKAFEESILWEIKSLSSKIPNPNIKPPNHLPYCFKFFYMLSYEEKRKFFKESFPLHQYNYQNMNHLLWYMISFVELFRFVKERSDNNNIGNQYQLNQKKVELKKKINHVWKKKHGFEYGQESIIYYFQNMIQDMFELFLEKHLRNEIQNNYHIRLFLLQNNKLVLKDPYVNYFLKDKNAFIKRIIDNEKNQMKIYHLEEEHFIVMERLNYVMTKLIQIFDMDLEKEEEFNKDMGFFFCLLFGIDQQTHIFVSNEDNQDREHEMVLMKFYRCLQKACKSQEFIFNIIINEESLFIMNDHFQNHLKEKLKKKFEAFILFLQTIDRSIIEYLTGYEIEHIFKLNIEKILQTNLLTKHLN